MTRVRDSNKAEKKERIRLAALELFARHGYDSTTMRDVARQAKVALGTLSLYATDKRDLTLLVFNERIADLTTVAVAAARKQAIQPLSDQLTAFFGVFYRDWEKNSTLARIFLQLNYYSLGMHSSAYQDNRKRVSKEIGEIVERSIREGEIRSTESIDVIAQHFFFLFSAAARWWIAEDEPVAEVGITHLNRLIQLQVRGLEPVSMNEANGKWPDAGKKLGRQATSTEAGDVGDETTKFATFTHGR